MAQSGTGWPTAAELQRIQEIIDRHHGNRPDAVKKVTPTFGEDQAGNPAIYLEILVSKDMEPSKDNIEELNDFVQLLVNDILENDSEYWPYARTLVEK